ncbi:hypothetical protein ACFTZB_01125 [Rhodococcus sp. NPDC057014]|uniref:hypothetical protein n=1 Tax=Rhodococcus sp. NPDC057014 TaxID=3346000 RepID=UPI0036414F23
MIGSFGPWASFLGFGTSGIDGDGVFTLILGLVGATAIFTLWGSGRSRYGLRWVGPVVGALCLVVAIVDIVAVASMRGELFGEPMGARVGWGLWMVTLGSLALCVTAAIAAVQIGQRTDRGPQPRLQPAIPSAGGPPGWMSVLIGVLAIALLGLIGYIAIGPRLVEEADRAERSAGSTESAPTTLRVTLNPGVDPVEALPSSARPCPPLFAAAEFTSSAVGTAVTSCGFAEEVRRQYLNQPQRGRPVTIEADSPVTGQRYPMGCGGVRVVTCSGGNNAVVYVY